MDIGIGTRKMIQKDGLIDIQHIHIYIYTRKPGRSPTRQYSVSRPFFTSAASLDFLECSQHMFLCNKLHDTLSML